MGTFDILNMRINGYDFHVSLMAGKESWDGPQGQDRSSTPGPACCPTTRPARSAAPGRRPRRPWSQKKAGMYLLGTFVGQQFTGADARRPRLLRLPGGRLRRIGTDAIEAPIDGFMMAKKPKNEAGAKELLEYLGSAEAREHLPQDRPERRRRATRRPTRAATTRCRRRRPSSSARPRTSPSSWTATRDPDFASTVMIPALQEFIKNPNDIDGLTSSIENQKKTIFV